MITYQLYLRDILSLMQQGRLEPLVIGFRYRGASQMKAHIETWKKLRHAYECMSYFDEFPQIIEITLQKVTIRQLLSYTDPTEESAIHE